MSSLFEISAVVRVLFVFAIILLAIHKKLALGHSFLLGSTILGLIFGLEPKLMAAIMLQSVIYPKTLSLAIIVSLILILSSSLKNAGQMERLLHNFKGLIKNPRINLVVFPALIGLLPMPGGAIFSAPMVKDLGAGINLSPSKLSYINYWFRHIWEYSWPLFPGILLVTVLSNISIVWFVIYAFPLTAVAVILGYIPLHGTPIREDPNGHQAARAPLKPFLVELTPILIAIVPGLLLGVIFSSLAPTLSIAKELGLHCSLCLGILWIWVSNRFSRHQIRTLLFSAEIMKMIYMVITILIFKGILEHSHAAEAISRELLAYAVPLLFITMLLPFLIGVISGYTLAFVGVSLPILIPLIQTYGESVYIYPYTMLIMVSGFAGVLFSPLHLCYILSNQFFKTSMSAVNRHLWLPTISLIGFGLIYFLISCRVIALT